MRNPPREALRRERRRIVGARAGEKGSDVSLLGFEGEDEGEVARSRGRRHPPSRRRRWRGLVAILVALGIVAVGGIVVYRVASGVLAGGSSGPTDYAGPGTTPVTVVIDPGSSTRTIARALADAGVVATDTAFLDAASGNGAAASIQPGTYTLRKQMSGAQALKAVLDPASRTGRISIPEGSTLTATLKLVSTRSGIPLARLTSAANALPAGPLAPYRPRTAEGFLFPATYDVPRTTPPAQVVQAMVDRFDQTATNLNLVAGAKALGLTPYQVVIVASLIEAEVSNPTDQAKVARVIYNRLHTGKRLELDSTVHYVSGRSGSVFTTDAERAVDSPYNTYKRAGLPPTPIDSPGASAIRAALAPAAGPWLFYVTVDLDTGKTLFATTGAQQQANARVLQQWCAANSGRC